MKLSMARVSVSSWTRQTCSRISLRETTLVGAVGEVAEEVGLHEGEVGECGCRGRWSSREPKRMVRPIEGVLVFWKSTEGMRGGVLGGGSSGCRRVEGALGLPGHAAEERAEAGEEDVEVEGFGEVVVGAGVDALEDVLGAGAGGEHEDGGVALGCSRRARAMVKPSAPGSMQSSRMAAGASGPEAGLARRSQARAEVAVSFEVRRCGSPRPGG